LTHDRFSLDHAVASAEPRGDKATGRGCFELLRLTASSGSLRAIDPRWQNLDLSFVPRLRVRRKLRAGKNVKQVQAWPGHSDPDFTVRTYIHLRDEGVGDADFLDDVGGGGRTIGNSDDG
jgi:hypothetical protein